MIKLLLPVCLLAVLFTTGCSDAGKPYYGALPIAPSIFYLGRDVEYPLNIHEIVEAAAEASFQNADEVWAFYENIVVVDEGRYWAVSFHFRGNGHLEPVRGWRKVDIANRNGFAVYLEKQTLTEPAKLPTRRLRFAPLISPALTEQRKVAAAREE